jgi:hypothetical protein
MHPRWVAVSVLSALTVCAAVSTPADACTIMYVHRSGMTLAGQNQDANNPNSKMWFVPPSAGQYGRVCFGFDKEYKIAESGMNDQGLFIGVNALDNDTGWKPDPGRPDWEEWEGWYVTGVPDGILAKCATVDEAVTVFETYNLLTFAKVKYLIGDKTGKSVVLEWSKNGLSIVERTGGYQISTNFVSSDYSRDDYPCERYRIADGILGAGEDASIGLVRAALSATCFEYFMFTPTLYSVIYNLDTGRFQVAFFHNFEERVEFDLGAELARGPSRHRLHDLFSQQSYAYTLYLKKAGGLDPAPE